MSALKPNRPNHLVFNLRIYFLILAVGCVMLKTGPLGAQEQGGQATGMVVDPQPAHILKGNQDTIFATCIGYNDSLVATGAKDGLVRVYDVATGEQIRLRTAQRGQPVAGAVFAPDESPLLITCGSGGIRLGYVVGESWVPEIPSRHTRMVLCAVVSPTIEHFASGGFDSRIVIWDLSSGKDIHHIDSAHEKAVSRLDFSTDGKLLLSSGYDGKICGWDPFSGMQRFSIQAHEGKCTAVELTPDNRGFISVGSDNTLRLWQIQERSAVDIGTTPSSPLRARIHPNGDWVAVGCTDGHLAVFSLKHPGEPLQQFKAHEGSLWDLAFGSSGRLLVTAGADKLAKLWRVGVQQP